MHVQKRDPHQFS